MIGGYMGRFLRVDLTTQQISNQAFSEEVLKKFIGGSGLGAKILFEETNETTNPLGPENVLIFMTGPLVGTNVPNFGRYQVVTKSPLTGAYGEANSGGTWGTMLKRAGIDGIIITGKSSSPVYFYIENKKAEIRDASNYWGEDTYDLDLKLKEELGNDIVTCCIGPAGENLVRIAAIMNDGKDGRAAGRCGVGAVMGSKNLKAIVVKKGNLRPPIVEPEKLKESIRNWAGKIRKNTELLSDYGTAVGLETVEAIGDLPVKNWTEGSFPSVEKVSGEMLKKTLFVKKYHCAQCVIGCGREVKVESGPYRGVEGAAPEYETIGMLGSNCLIDDLEAIAKANELCNRYGLDTISTGAAISFAMEAYERGIITERQLGGIQLDWGNAEAMIKMIHKIAVREDLGYLLGEGTRRAAEKIGGLAQELVVHVKGLDLPAHDPRAKYSNALAYATSARGACHLNAFSYEFEDGISMAELGYPETLDRFTIRGKAQLVAKLQDLMALFDSLTGCKFIIFGLGDETIKTIVEWLNLVTGWHITREEFLEIGARIVNLKKVYNVKCGLTRKDDVLPYRILSHKRGTGGAGDNLPHLGEMLGQYYEYRGWDEFGIPREETLKKYEII
ncbi:MAG: aldehyde:ferredoxin oxidoreductase [Clostridia bacterium]|nr:aldehyde:ferredoxin oxidoreductase [Clostridia bacterium]